MKAYRFTILFGAILVVLFIGFCAWHSPWEDRLTQAEIDHYMAIIEKLPLPAEEIEARAIDLLRQDPQMRQEFLNRVAGPIANRMFECGMIP